MAGDLSFALKLRADAANFVQGLTQAQGQTKRFASGVKSEFASVKGKAESLTRVVAGVGLVGLSAAALKSSAQMDKRITQIGLSANASKDEMARFRDEIKRIAGETGQNTEALREQAAQLVDVGFGAKSTLPALDAINKTIAVTGGNANNLAESLAVARDAFGFDLDNPTKALEIIDKMEASTSYGNVQLENLSRIFTLVGGDARKAGMSFEQTLAFVQNLSSLKIDPKKLQSLTQGALGLFESEDSMQKIWAATGGHQGGVKFTNADGNRRDPIEVLKDVKAKYDKLGDFKSRKMFMTDLGLSSDMESLLSGNVLESVGSTARQLEGAGGEIAKKLPQALDNAAVQAARLREQLKGAADDFAKPFDYVINKTLQWGMNKKEDGGLGLSGLEFLGAAGAAGFAGYGALRYAGGKIGRLAGKAGGTAAGVAEGKALEAAAGITPVFVTNWPEGGLGIPGGMPEIPGAPGGKTSLVSTAVTAGRAALAAPSMGAIIAGGAATTAAAAGLVAAVGAASYAVGSVVNEKYIEGTGFSDKLGRAIARVMSDLGSEKAKDALAAEDRARETEVGGKVTIELVGGGSVASIRSTSTNPNVPIDVGYMVQLSN